MIPIFDENNKNSVINRLTPTVAEALSKLPRKYFEMTPEELEKRTKPSAIINAIRLSFWLEYNRVLMEGPKEKINNTRVFSPFCTEHYFYALLKKDIIMAWVMTPPLSYEVMMEETLDLAVKKLRQLVTDFDFKDKSGRVNPRSVDVFLKAFAVIDARVKGSVIQKKQHLHFHKTDGVGAGVDDTKDVTDSSQNQNVIQKTLSERVAGQLQAKVHDKTYEVKQREKVLVSDE